MLKKIHVLTRIAPFISLLKRKSIMHEFASAQVNDRVFNNRKFSNRITRLHIDA